ncbi:PREDICTED: HMG domain-containing protein 4 [Tauraco erythrolophus]|uniref:HMG domain-containing protein 4 n=1 Tax=Tauraco erythrolophus TaxID=121530 RepID=UPI0005233288|nr:PREDICTED: HMG domain-containing protein 4 [Tauraco erythrolophus]
MAYDDSKKKEEFLESDRSVDDVGLATGKIQRDKKRSYKDLVQEEDEIATQVRKPSEKRLKDSDLFPGTEPHKKKRKHSSDEFCHRSVPPLDLPSKKKKKAVSSPSSADTTMDLVKVITSPLATSSKSSKKTSEKSSHSSSGHSESKKEHHKKKLSGSSGEHSVDDGSFHKSKKMKPLYVNTETLTLREPDGLKMKLILSPKEKSSTADDDSFSYSSAPAAAKKSSKKSARDEQGSFLLGHELQSFLKSSRKKHKPPPDPHPPSDSFGADTSLFSEGHGNEYEISGMEAPPESGSSSGGELEAGELVIDDSYREIKKKKKSKKSKKKKDKEKHRDKKHSKSRKSSGHAPVAVPEVTVSPPPPPGTSYVLPPPPPAVFHSDGQGEKRRKKEDKEKDKEREREKPKKKNMSAYQVFCKEYRTTIVSEHPGIDFGELSKKLAEVWKQLPEKDKLIWKQKAQYLQHKQNKAEATTVKRKASSSDVAPKIKASPTGVVSPHKKSPTSTVVVSSSPAKVPDTDPIDVAAHLQLLGESLSLIGHRLQETEGMVAVSGSLSVLLDSIVCALGPLACLTTQLPELNGCPKHVLSNTLDNIAYIMPGL